MSKLERFWWSLTVAALIGALIGLFIWFPVSHERLLQEEHGYHHHLQSNWWGGREAKNEK